MRKIVFPGELVMSGMDYVPSQGAFREGKDIYSKIVGLLEISGRVIKVIPLAGKYLPEKDDNIIGVIDEVGLSGWQVNINCPYTAFFPSSETREFIGRDADLSNYYDYKDIFYGKILNVSKFKIVKISTRDREREDEYGKLEGGRILSITPCKIPRLIGKSGSMINMIKEKTKCKIVVGQNGLVWIKGTPENEAIIARAVKLIDEEAHLSGLTDKIKNLLGEKNGI